jgi:hypothetical protein
MQGKKRQLCGKGEPILLVNQNYPSYGFKQHTTHGMTLSFKGSYQENVKERSLVREKAGIYLSPM